MSEAAGSAGWPTHPGITLWMDAFEDRHDVHGSAFQPITQDIAPLNQRTGCLVVG